jgi:glycosyltransferase involved in cell wall biosynthesis
MLISIIIPTRNRYNFIKLLLEDILNQNISNYEVIVVDQSDTHQSLENCLHINSDTLGPCVSRNIGVKHAKGEILVFLDDDARIDSNFVHEITHPILNKKFDVVAGAICDPSGNYLKEDADYLSAYGDNFIKVLTSNPDSPSSRISLSFPTGCVAVLKTALTSVGGFDESFDPTGAGEDRDMALKLFKASYRTWYNANAKLKHELAPSGGTRELGSRGLNLDVHTYLMCKKYFTETLTQELKKSILLKYREKIVTSILKFNLIRTSWYQYLEVKKRLN